MPTKPSNPSSKDLDDVIQATHLYIEDDITHTHHQNDERFQAASQNLELQLGNIHTRMDNQQLILDSRHESVMTLIIKLMNQQQNGGHHSTTTSSLTAAFSAATSASISQIPPFPPGYGPVFTSINSPLPPTLPILHSFLLIM